MSNTLSVRLEPHEVEDVHTAMRLRGIRTRSDFARQAIARAVAATRMEMAQFSVRPPLQSPAPAADQPTPCRSGGHAAGQVQEEQS